MDEAITKPRKCSECVDTDSCQKFAVLGDFGSVCDAGEMREEDEAINERGGLCDELYKGECIEDAQTDEQNTGGGRWMRPADRRKWRP